MREAVGGLSVTSTIEPRRRARRYRPNLLGVVCPLLVIGIWEGLARSGITNPLFLPPPTKVLDRAVGYFFTTGTAWNDILGSSYRVMVGFLLGAVVGIPLGLATGLWSKVDDAISPTINVLKNIAPIAWIPLAILWFGLGDRPAFFLLFIGAFFPVVLNTVSGVRGIDRIYLRVARNVGAKGPFLFWHVILPGALPSIVTGLRVALGISWMIVIIAEMVAVPNGLGYRLTQAREYGWTDLVLVTMATVGACGYLFDLAATKIAARLLRWHTGIREAS